MIRISVVLAALLCTGCAMAAKREAASAPAAISPTSWQQLQIDLRDTPVQLRRAIMLAGEARLPQAEHPLAGSIVEAQSSHALLVDIAAGSRDTMLQPDAEFHRLQDIVLGEERHQELPYAAALAGYLTQPDFDCRQPLYGRYFQRRYSAATGVSRCRDQVPFSVISRHDAAGVVWLDPKRVSSIHLLFAGKSQSMASRFGHLALRLVVCPEGKTSAAQCDTNLFEHLVLGYQAHIDELSLDTLKALTGDYKAYLFANRFMDVYQEYAIGEFREIYSLPLRLDDGQRELLVRELSELHWSFAGSYNFFTRNCATLLQNALRASWPEFAASDTLSSNFSRPDNLFEAIKSSSLTESERLASLEVAEREGYYFSSTRGFYQDALIEVRAQMKLPEFSDIDGYLGINPIKRRADRAADPQFLARLAADRHLLEAQIMLEEYALLRGERLLMIEGAKYLEQQDFAGRSDSIRAQLDAEHAKIFDECLLGPFKQYTNPIRRVSGIPDKSHLPAIPSPTSHCQSRQSSQLLHETIGMIQDAKSEQWQQLLAASHYLSECVTNINLLKDML